MMITSASLIRLSLNASLRCVSAFTSICASRSIRSKHTVYPAFTASMPSAIARWVFPLWNIFHNGKSFLSRALARNACESGYRTKVVSFSALMRELARLDKADTDKYEKRLAYYSRFPVLLIDEWLCQQPDKQWVTILLELMENRYDATSTIICTQLPPENWPTVIGNVALGQAILGRVQAASFTLFLEGPDLRAKHSRKP